MRANTQQIIGNIKYQLSVRILNGIVANQYIGFHKWELE